MPKNFIISSGLRDHLQTIGNRRTALEASGNAVITIYAGVIPADANDSVGAATPLVTLTTNAAAPDGSNGLVFDPTLQDGTLVKPSAAVWSGTVTNGGASEASFFRWHDYTDDQTGTASATAIRMQGTCGLPTGVWDMLLDDLALTDASVFSLPSFFYRHPRSESGL